MYARIQGMAALALLTWATMGQGQDMGQGQELLWRPAGTRPATDRAAVNLGRPQPARPAPEPAVSIGLPLTDVPASHGEAGYTPIAAGPVRVVARGQAPDAPPPPPPPPPQGFGSPVPGVNPGEEAFNCGVANTPHAGGGFFSKFCDNIKGAWKDVTGSIRTGSGGAPFQSDHKFDFFTSPVSNPFYFEDPRALTEFRPLFIWQRTPNSNPIFAGSSNFFVGARGSVAFTDWISLTVDELGWLFINPNNPVGDFQRNNGFSELHLGPKVTFLRNDVSGTVAAGGLIFEVPTGPGTVFQSTKDWGLTPYFSIAQNFWRSDYGTFNFMNTDGYSFGIGRPRGDFFYASFHLDYDVGNLRKIYPLVELNWVYYAKNGNREPINFEGRDLFHFGATSVHGLNELTLALGARYKVSEHLQLGLVGEFNAVGGSRHLDAFRMTFDMIFRY